MIWRFEPSGTHVQSIGAMLKSISHVYSILAHFAHHAFIRIGRIQLSISDVMKRTTESNCLHLANTDGYFINEASLWNVFKNLCSCCVHNYKCTSKSNCARVDKYVQADVNKVYNTVMLRDVYNYDLNTYIMDNAQHFDYIQRSKGVFQTRSYVFLENAIWATLECADDNHDVYHGIKARDFLYMRKKCVCFLELAKKKVVLSTPRMFNDIILRNIAPEYIDRRHILQHMMNKPRKISALHVPILFDRKGLSEKDVEHIRHLQDDTLGLRIEFSGNSNFKIIDLNTGETIINVF